MSSVLKRYALLLRPFALRLYVVFRRTSAFRHPNGQIYGSLALSIVASTSFRLAS